MNEQLVASREIVTSNLSANDEKLWKPYLRLFWTLGFHLIVLAAELSAICLFATTGNKYFTYVLIVPFILSGFLCTIAAWHANTPHLGCSFLPLKKRHWLVRVVLVVPFGLFQGVIVTLELEEFCAAIRPLGTTTSVDFKQHLSDVQRNDESFLDTFHCKAVNGVFEGLAFAGVIFLGYLGVGFPEYDPITTLPEDWDPDVTAGFLQVLLWISSISVGICLTQVDSAVSPTRVRRKMKESYAYQVYHIIFRLAEVTSRLSLLISYFCLIATGRRRTGWWCPLIFELVLSVFLVDLYGGCEVTMLVRLICAAPCVCADVFRFVDSPYKRRAAHKLSRAFVFRNMLETVALPAIYYFLFPDAGKDLYELICSHRVSLVGALLSHPVYWLSLWCITSWLRDEDSEYRDIFSACESGNMQDVMFFTSDSLCGINMNIFDIDGKTPLMLAVQRCSAAMNGSAEAATAAAICSLLVEEGAQVDLPIFEDNRWIWNILHKPMRRRWTALHMAAWYGCSLVVEALVESEQNFGGSFDSSADADLPWIDKQGETPMHVAAEKGYGDIVHIFMSTWPSWAALKNRRGKTPLDIAASEDVQRAIQEGSQTELRKIASGATATDASPSPSSKDCDWQAVRLPIFHNFRDKGGPCRAPGLSSYLASIGGGALGKAFLVDETMLQTIDENNALAAASFRASFQASFHVTNNQSQRRLSLESGLTADGTSNSYQSEGSVSVVETLPRSTSRSFRPVPMLEDLEPIDRDGNVIEIWSNYVREAERQGHPLGAYAYQWIDPRSVLGQGSFGIVWRAHDRTTRVKYAVKNMRSQQAEVSSLAQRELDMSNHVRLQPHPCIVAFHQIFAFPGFCMIVMEYCPCGDLLRPIRQARQEAASAEVAYEPPALAQRWIGQIFLGLEHLHLKMRSMLRDIKPENIVLTDRGIAKLTDFGLGRGDASSNGTWSFGFPPGSPGYIAPESLLQQQYDFRTDLYSFGVVIWVLLTGGVKYDPQPRPPLGTKKSRSDFMAHANDWRHLQQCIQNPHQHHACPLPTMAVKLVTGLTQKRQADRPLHPEIRQDPLLQELGLPELSASPAVVNTWLAVDEKDGSASSQASSGED